MQRKSTGHHSSPEGRLLFLSARWCLGAVLSSEGFSIKAMFWTQFSMGSPSIQNSYCNEVSVQKLRDEKITTALQLFFTTLSECVALDQLSALQRSTQICLKTMCQNTQQKRLVKRTYNRHVNSLLSISLSLSHPLSAFGWKLLSKFWKENYDYFRTKFQDTLLGHQTQQGSLSWLRVVALMVDEC